MPDDTDKQAFEPVRVLVVEDEILIQQLVETVLAEAGYEVTVVSSPDEAIALLREIASRERDDDGDVIIGTDADGHNDLMSRIAAFLATHDR